MESVWADAFWAPYLYTAWAWAVLLLIIGLALAIMEVFVPSGGILGFLSLSSIVAAIVVGFMDGRSWIGMTVLSVAVFGLPSVLVFALKVWPSTPMGRRMLLGVPTGDEVMPDIPRQRSLKDLVGRVGYAKSKMLPSGAVSIEGRTIDAVSEGMPIEVRQRVRVIEVHGSRVVVRPLDEDEPSQDDPDLSRPIDVVLLDPFDEPPT